MTNYEDLTVDELKDELASRDLKVSGNKDDLIERLEADDATEEAPVEEATAEVEADAAITTTASLHENNEDKAHLRTGWSAQGTMQARHERAAAAKAAQSE